VIVSVVIVNVNVYFKHNTQFSRLFRPSGLEVNGPHGLPI